MRNGLGRPGITLHHHRLSSTLTFSQRLAEMISSFGKDRKIEKKKLTYSISWKNEKANKRKTFCTHTQRERDGDLQTLTLCIHIVVTSQTDRGRYRAASRTCVEREREKKKGGQGRRPPSLRRFCCVSFYYFIFFSSRLCGQGPPLPPPPLPLPPLPLWPSCLTVHLLRIFYSSLFLFSVVRLDKKVPGRFFREKKWGKDKTRQTEKSIGIDRLNQMRNTRGRLRFW